MSTIVRVYRAIEAMHHEVSCRLTKNPDTPATSHCQQCFRRSENSPRELPRSKEQRRSSVLLLKCNRSTEVDVWSDLSLMRRSAPEVEHESALRVCVDLVSLNVCQHCSCTSVHILCTPANVVLKSLAKQSSTVSNHNIHSTFFCFSFFFLFFFFF